MECFTAGNNYKYGGRGRDRRVDVSVVNSTSPDRRQTELVWLLSVDEDAALMQSLRPVRSESSGTQDFRRSHIAELSHWAYPRRAHTHPANDFAHFTSHYIT